MSYKKQAVVELVNKIKAAGFRVFLAGSGEYGFYTDAEGTRVISFGIDLGVPTFSGNYKAENPKQTGTGFVICDGYPDSFERVFNAVPNRVGSNKYTFSTLEQHLNTYQQSSKYVEV